MGTSSSERKVCIRPFEWFEVHAGGDVFFCCPAWLRMPAGNLFRQTVPEIWNGPEAAKIRAGLLGGAFQGCSRKNCPHLTRGGGPVCSAAQVMDERIRSALRRKESCLGYGPKILNLCYDHSCNLACPTCRTQPWICDGEEADRHRRLFQKIREGAGPSAETLIISGAGDPFGSRHFREVLRSFRKEEWPRLQSIRLHTNGQLWNECSWAELKAIHPWVKEAEVSIDAATAETYAENRRGGDFSRLMENLRFIRTLPIRLTLSFVVQENNYKEIPAFAELGGRFGARVYFSRLVNWGTFTREEYRARAVHLPRHPDHDRLREILRSLPVSEDIDLGNLRPLVF